MMFRMARMLLIWLLALALPAQGVMAATMVFCGPNHHDRAAAASHDAGSAHRSLGSAVNSHHEAVDGQAEYTAPGEAAESETLSPSGMQKCSVCASCCSVSAIHGTVPKLPALEPMAADFAALVPAVEPFTADGPDRPPRHLLA
jgi:hypothetical protein